ncbi:hypothetical protein [Sorangium sp. So ce1389]|uniref:hypothetical protein n=1 Tax=Sorangium sp. So ce1389 TaxID=3133336 RepID=UPI003F5F5964
MSTAELTSNRDRKQQTKEELTAFQEDVKRWLAHRRDQDKPRQQHWSQLNAVESCLLGAADHLARQLADSAREDAPAGELYAMCRRFDLRVCWLQRLWHYFRQRLDQRDDPALRPLLDAADDVVWSCYRPAVTIAGDAAPELRRGAPPLPFIDHEFSPAATPADWVPEALKREGGFLLNYLRALPFPVVHLPATTLRSPWMLVLVGHEVGHHVQLELGLDEVFQGRIEGAVRTAGGDGAAWARWSREIFADAYSVFTMGSEAVRAMAELSRDVPAKMARRHEPEEDDKYPPPAVRLALLAALAERLGLPDTGALDGWRPADCARNYPECKADLDMVSVVVEVCCEPLPLPGAQGAFSLRDLCGFDAAVFPADGQLPFIAPGLPSARIATSAAMTRWARAAEAGGQRPFVALRRELFGQIHQGRAPGLRAPSDAPPAGRDERLGELLMNAKLEELTPT